MNNVFLDVENGDDRALESYLKLENINIQNENGESLLHCAIKFDNDYAFDLLIKNYIDLNIQDNTGATPLIYSILYNKVGYFKRLVREHANLNISNNKHESPIMIALNRNRNEMAKILFDEKVDLSIKNKNDENIYFSVVKSHNLELLEEMLKDNEKYLDSVNYTKRTLLHQAVMISDIAIAKYLLDKGILSNVEDNFGETPLFFAVRNNNKEMVSLLMEYGALLGKTNSFFETINDIASEDMKDFISYKQSSVKYDKYIKKYPLHVAVIYNDYNRCRQLLNRYLISKKDDYNLTVLDYAKKLNHIEILNMITQYNNKRQ